MWSWISSRLALVIALSTAWRTPKRLSLSDARSLGSGILVRAGLPNDSAAEVSDHLISADASGHASHVRGGIPKVTIRRA